MKSPQMIGTILPTQESLRVSNEHADNLEAKRERVGQELLGGYTRKVFGGEVRWYDGKDSYAIIGRDDKPRWFTRRKDGYWYIDRARTR